MKSASVPSCASNGCSVGYMAHRHMHLGKRYASLLLLGAVLLGCSREANDAGVQSPGRSGVGPAFTAMPAPPVECNGIGGLSTVEELVASGEAVALISATIKAEPGAIENNERTVAVESYTLVAGELPYGPVSMIAEAAASEKTNPLAPGSYLVLLGTSGPDAAYFLSDGRRGTFVLNGESAYEQCPNYSDPDHTTVMRSGVTNVPDLVNLFAKAFSEDLGG